jgi:hypothetical protein
LAGAIADDYTGVLTGPAELVTQLGLLKAVSTRRSVFAAAG